MRAKVTHSKSLHENKKLQTVSNFAICRFNCWPFLVPEAEVHVVVSDLFGLLLFLGEEPYNSEFWWKHLLLLPYCNGDTEPLVTVLSKCFRRTMKRSVLDQIGVPPQENKFYTLKFCPVEEVFYKRQASKCASAFLEQVTRFPDHTLQVENLDRRSVANVSWSPVLS